MSNTYTQPTPDQYAMEFLKNLQNTPKFDFADKGTKKLGNTLGDQVLGMTAKGAQGVLNIPSNLVRGSTRIGEQLGNGLVGNPVDWGQAKNGAGDLTSAFLHGLMVQNAGIAGNKILDIGAPKEVTSAEGFIQDAQGNWRDPLNGNYVKPDLVNKVSQAFRTIPIKQGGQQVGEIPMPVQQLMQKGQFLSQLGGK